MKPIKNCKIKREWEKEDKKAWQREWVNLIKVYYMHVWKYHKVLIRLVLHKVENERILKILRVHS
jgi:hypothetical protein